MSRTSQEIRDAIRSVNIHARVTFGRHKLVVMEIDRATTGIGVTLLNHQGVGDPSQMPLGGYLDNPVVRHLSELKTLREIIEESPQFAEAQRVLVPLYAELAEAEAREAEEAAAAAAARHALEEARAAALAKAEAKLDSDPAVKKAREALEAIAGPAPAADPEPAPAIAEPVAELPSDELDIGRELQADLH
jgi:hypothetical protein